MKKNKSESWTWEDPKLQICYDVAQGMAYIHNTSYYSEELQSHQDNLIHRDLKTSNVLLMKDLTAKISDFGSMKALVTTDMTITGTPIYMAPEVVRGESYNTSADVYSFAIMLASHHQRLFHLKHLQRGH